MSDRALIIKKRWLDLIFDGKKPWEIRGSNTNIRGKILLIESGSGFIVGECELVNTYSIKDLAGVEKLIKKHGIEDWQGTVKYKDPYVWILARPKRYKKQIPYNHPQGAVMG